MLILFLILLFLTSPVHAGLVIGTGTNYSDIILWEDFATNDGNITSSNCNTGTDTTWSLNSAAAIDATAKLSGDYGLDVKGADDFAALSTDNSDYINGTKGAIAFMLKVVTGAGSATIFRAYSTTDSTDYAYLRFKSGDATNLQFAWVTNGASEASCVTAGGVMADGTQYYIVLTWDTDANATGVYIYDSSGSLLDSDTSSNATTAIVFDDQIRFGEYAGIATVLYLDKIIIFDGSIARTPAEYMAICKDVASCPL